MPTYQYECNDCNDDFDVNKRYTDEDTIVFCPNCQGKNTLRVILAPPTIVYKSTGFTKKIPEEE